MMIGLGTIINVAAILLGGVIGLLFGKFITPRFQEILMRSNGICVMFIGIAGALQQMVLVGDGGRLSSIDGRAMILIVSMAVGSFLGELINIDRQFERFGDFLKQKTGNAKDPQFVEGFLIASFTVCIGAMTIVGSIEDGMFGKYETLLAKSILDFILLIILSASMGKGCLFSALPVAVIQGLLTMLAFFMGDLLPTASLENLSLVGSVLIFCVGFNLVRKNTVKVANMIPAIAIAIIWGFFA